MPARRDPGRISGAIPGVSRCDLGVVSVRSRCHLDLSAPAEHQLGAISASYCSISALHCFILAQLVTQPIRVTAVASLVLTDRTSMYLSSTPNSMRVPVGVLPVLLSMSHGRLLTESLLTAARSLCCVQDGMIYICAYLYVLCGHVGQRVMKGGSVKASSDINLKVVTKTRTRPERWRHAKNCAKHDVK